MIFVSQFLRISKNNFYRCIIIIVHLIFRVIFRVLYAKEAYSPEIIGRKLENKLIAKHEIRK